LIGGAGEPESAASVVDNKPIHDDLTVGVNRHLDPNSEAGVGCPTLTYEPGIVVENKRNRFGRDDVRDVKQAVIPLIASTGRLPDSSALGVDVELKVFFPARPHEGLNYRMKGPADIDGLYTIGHCEGER
jgi:hypothetical protein